MNHGTKDAFSQLLSPNYFQNNFKNYSSKRFLKNEQQSTLFFEWSIIFLLRQGFKKNHQPASTSVSFALVSVCKPTPGLSTSHLKKKKKQSDATRVRKQSSTKWPCRDNAPATAALAQQQISNVFLVALPESLIVSHPSLSAWWYRAGNIQLLAGRRRQAWSTVVTELCSACSVLQEARVRQQQQQQPAN